MTPVQTFYKSIGDISIYCEVFAKGELAVGCDPEGAFLSGKENCIIFSHGNGEDGRIFSSVIEPLCKDFYCIIMDSRGHGKTDSGSEDFTVDLLAEDISKLADALLLPKFSLCGFSDGGNAAITYAFRHPERLTKLCVVGANLNPQGLTFSAKVPIFSAYMIASSNKNKNQDAWLKYQLLSLMVNYPHISPRMLKNIVCPTLVVDAERDLIKKKHTELIAYSIPSSKRVTVPESSHNIFFSNPEYSAKILKSFFCE